MTLPKRVAEPSWRGRTHPFVSGVLPERTTIRSADPSPWRLIGDSHRSCASLEMSQATSWSVSPLFTRLAQSGLAMMALPTPTRSISSAADHFGQSGDIVGRRGERADLFISRHERTAEADRADRHRHGAAEPLRPLSEREWAVLWERRLPIAPGRTVEEINPGFDKRRKELAQLFEGTQRSQLIVARHLPLREAQSDRKSAAVASRIAWMVSTANFVRCPMSPL